MAAAWDIRQSVTRLPTVLYDPHALSRNLFINYILSFMLGHDFSPIRCVLYLTSEYSLRLISLRSVYIHILDIGGVTARIVVTRTPTTRISRQVASCAKYVIMENLT